MGDTSEPTTPQKTDATEPVKSSDVTTGAPTSAGPGGVDKTSTPLPKLDDEPESSGPATPPQVAVGGKGGNKGLLIGAIIAVIVLVGGGVGAFLLTGNKKDEDDKPKQTAAAIKVGVMLPFSGGSSSMGYGAMKGIQLAKKQLNADNIELVQADGKCDPKVAAEALQKLIDQKVAVVIGEACSSASVGALPLANEKKMLMRISPFIALYHPFSPQPPQSSRPLPSFPLNTAIQMSVPAYAGTTGGETGSGSTFRKYDLPVPADTGASTGGQAP